MAGPWSIDCDIVRRLNHGLDLTHFVGGRESNYERQDRPWKQAHYHRDPGDAPLRLHAGPFHPAPDADPQGDGLHEWRSARCGAPPAAAPLAEAACSAET